MKSLLVAVTLFFVASAKLQATEALIFDGGGHNLYILIGGADKPVVAQVRYTPPGAKDWIDVPMDQLKIEKFDMKAQVLTMRFSNEKNDPALPPPFSFSAKKKTAVLTIKGKTIKSSFNWLDQ